MRKQYLDELEDHFSQHGTYPYPLKTFIRDEEFQKAMKYRSLPIPKSLTTPLNELNPTERAIIRSISNYHDPRPLRTKLKELNVSTQDYHKLLRRPIFKEALLAELNRNTAHLPVDSQLALASLIQSNDLNAIKYYNELTGIYRPNNETLLNLSLILAQLMDILTTYLRPDQLADVADKLERVVLNAGSSEARISLPVGEDQ